MIDYCNDCDCLDPNAPEECKNTLSNKTCAKKAKNKKFCTKNYGKKNCALTCGNVVEMFGVKRNVKSKSRKIANFARKMLARKIVHCLVINAKTNTIHTKKKRSPF